MDVWNQLSDNQLALLGCLGACGFSMLMLAISFHSNSANRPAAVELPEHQPSSESAEIPQRRAA